MFEDREFKSDVLVIGGGIAGCMAAIRASELVNDVILVEKCNTQRSGCATTGVDHVWTYIPPIHGEQGYTLEDIVEDHSNAYGGFVDKRILRIIAENSFGRILELEKYGIEIRDENGDFRLIKKIHRVPTFLHFAGRDLKVKLTKEVRKRGVKIINRVMATELLVQNGKVVGAIGVGTRDEIFYTFKAPSVILSTGGAYGMYRSPTGLLNNMAFPPHETGDGRAMAYRAGAEMVGMEFTTYQIGPKNFQRCGRGSYVPGVLVNSRGEKITGNLEEDLGVKAIDSSVENPNLFFQIQEKGSGPIYMDCTGNSKEEIEYIQWALENEGNLALLRHMEKSGISFSEHLIEFTIYEPKIGLAKAGILIDENCRTSISGLYAAGDEIGNVPRAVSPGALVLGHRAGEKAALFSKDSSIGEFTPEIENFIDHTRSMYEKFLSREKGASWTEAKIALQNIMEGYCGRIRSETMLEAGLLYLRRLRDTAVKELKANDPHELSRCLGVLNLMDCGEMIILSALTRKESRFALEHYRVDYPETNPEWDCFLVFRKEKEGVVFEKRPLELYRGD